MAARRLVVDPERLGDDAAEPMAARGWGVRYERDADANVWWLTDCLTNWIESRMEQGF